MVSELLRVIIRVIIAPSTASPVIRNTAVMRPTPL
jgi:hypothetical protein